MGREETDLILVKLCGFGNSLSGISKAGKERGKGEGGREEKGGKESEQEVGKVTNLL
jgi:hypothetical protein